MFNRLQEKVWDAVASKVSSHIKSRLKEQSEEAPVGFTIDSDDHLFRSMGRFMRDLEPISAERGVNISFMLYDKNPLARRLIDTPIQAIESAGLTIEAEDEIVQSFVDEFWSDNLSGFKRMFFPFMRSLAMTGELSLPIGVNEIDGSLDFAYIDPVNIDKILPKSGNALIPDKIVMKQSASQSKSQADVYEIMRYNGAIFSGQVFHYPINNPVNSTRGRGQLLAHLDWLDIYDDALFNEAERWKALKAYAYDVEINGADEAAQQAYLKKHFSGDVNSLRVHVHNDKVKMNAVTPDLKAQDGATIIRVLRNHIVGGAGYPGFFFGFAEDANLAGAKEMLTPAVWMIEQQQRWAEYILTFIATLAVEEAKKHGKYTEAGQMTMKLPSKLKVKSASVFPRDMVQLSAMFMQVVSALSSALTNKIINQRKAVEMMAFALSHLGFETTADELEELDDSANVGELGNSVDDSQFVVTHQGKLAVTKDLLHSYQKGLTKLRKARSNGHAKPAY